MDTLLDATFDDFDYNIYKRSVNGVPLSYQEIQEQRKKQLQEALDKDFYVDLGGYTFGRLTFSFPKGRQTTSPAGQVVCEFFSQKKIPPTLASTASKRELVG